MVCGVTWLGLAASIETEHHSSVSTLCSLRLTRKGKGVNNTTDRPRYTKICINHKRNSLGDLNVCKTSLMCSIDATPQNYDPRKRKKNAKVWTR